MHKSSCQQLLRFSNCVGTPSPDSNWVVVNILIPFAAPLPGPPLSTVHPHAFSKMVKLINFAQSVLNQSTKLFLEYLAVSNFEILNIVQNIVITLWENFQYCLTKDNSNDNSRYFKPWTFPTIPCSFPSTIALSPRFPEISRADCWLSAYLNWAHKIQYKYKYQFSSEIVMQMCNANMYNISDITGSIEV